MCISLHVGVTSCMHQRLHECGELHSVAGVHYRNLLSGLSTGCKERQFGTRCTVVLVFNGWCKAKSLGACCSGVAGRFCWHWHSRCRIRAPLTRLIRQCRRRHIERSACHGIACTMSSVESLDCQQVAAAMLGLYAALFCGVVRPTHSARDPHTRLRLGADFDCGH